MKLGFCHRGIDETYTAEIVRSQNEVASFCKAVHDQLAISEKAEDVLEVENDISVGFVRGRRGYIGLYACDFRNYAG